MMRIRAALFSLSFTLLIFICASPSFGQAVTGTPPFGSFGGGPDVINLGNLNSHITVPVLNKAGRGTPFTYNISYDTSVWYPVTSNGTTSWQPVYNWGWRGQTEIASGYLSYFSQQSNSCCSQVCYPRIGCWQVCTGATFHYSSFVYHDQFGVPHPIPGTTTSAVGPGSCANYPPSLTATANDGSGYTLNFTGSATITSRAGSVWNVPINTGTGAAAYTDRNGNEITENSSGVFTDTLGTTALTVSGTAPSPTTFTYVAPSGANAAYTMKYTSYTVLTNFGCSGITEYSATGVPLVSEIDLPDGTKYTFTYEQTPSHSGDVTGRLASVTLPTGGEISYTYTGGSNGIECANGSTAGLTRITPDGTWTYARSGSGSAWTSTVTDPSSSANQTVVNFQQESTSQNFYQTERQVYQGSSTSGTLLKTVYTCYNGSASPCNSTAITLPIAQRTVLLQWPGGLQSKTNTSYNSYGSVTETDEYAYGTGAPGSIVRKTLTTYASLGNGIVGMPASITVEDGSNNVKSQGTYSYDQTAVTATSGTPQQVAISGSRGNATTVSYLVQGSTTLSKTFTYFDTGNVQTTTDVNGAQTTYTYGTGSCGNSFVASISEPLSLSRSMTWNCTGGVGTSVTDENGKTVTTNYATDPDFWRPNSATDQISNTTNLTYSGQTSAESSLLFNGSAATTDVLTNLDGLGRAHVSQRREGPSSSTYDSVETDYDSLGRSNRTTLPYSGTAGQTNSSAPGTTTTYDALGRKTQLTDSGGKSITYSYSQNDKYNTVGPAPTGENTKRKQFEYDALGRLTSVCEITSATGSGTCGQTNAATGYWTEYTYNILNQLIGVAQNAQSSSTQSRTYAYDDLGRMTSEINPESSTTTYTYDADSTCGTSKGDLVKKVDAVGNITCYTYDALHRITSTIISSGSYASVTPNKYFVYDSATVNSVTMANAKARMAEAYTCVSPCSSKITDIGFSYTARGEPSNVYQSTPHSSGYYQVTQTYWANGAPNVLSNLVGLPTITYSVDGEGRVYSATASSGQNPLSSTTYNVASQPSQVSLGSSDGDAFTYDPNTNRMTQYQFTVNGQSVVGALTWNAIGTLETLAITDPFNSSDAQTCSYAHDDLIRIASANCGSVWSQTFSYDAFGNLSKSGTSSFQPTYSYQTNHMTQIGSSTPTYDGNGNVTNDFLHTYAWDAASRPVTIDGVGVTYDALGRMVEQNRSGTYTEIVYAPSGAKLSLMSGQTLTKAFIPLTGGAVAVYNSSGLAYYRHSDHLGSSRFASTPSRTMYSDGAYGPFGEPYAQSGTSDPSFTGMNQDTVTNLYDFAAREYGIQGRWPSSDPLGMGAASRGNPQSWNRYAYLLNNPMSMTDASGLLCKRGEMCSMAMSGDFPTYVNVDTSGMQGFPSMSQAVTDAQGQVAQNNAQLAAAQKAATDIPGYDATSPVPTSLSILSVTFAPPASLLGIYVPGDDWGGGAVIQYQVLDQYGYPMQVAGMTPVEALQQQFATTPGRSLYFGPLGWPTDSSGQFTDPGIGSDGNGPFASIFTQSIFMNYQGGGYLVATNTWSVAASIFSTNVSGSNGVNVSGSWPWNGNYVNSHAPY